MGWKDSLHEAMRDYLIRQGYDAARVVSYEEEERSDGYCETCYYDWTVVVIKYEFPDGSTDTFEYYGDFATLVRELTDD